MINFFKKDENNNDKKLFDENITQSITHEPFNPDKQNYDSFVDTLIKSWKDKGIKFNDDGSKKDPMTALYNTALDMTQKQVSGEPDVKRGDWETTEMVDDNFANLIDSAKKSPEFKDAFKDVNLDEYDPELFKSSGQKYRDKYIKPNSGENALSDAGNALQYVNYHGGKLLHDAIGSIPGLGDYFKENVSSDDLMPIGSALTDFATSKAGGSLGSLVGGGLGSLGAGVGAVPGAAIGNVVGSTVLPAVKTGLFEEQPNYVKANSKIDPITGNEISNEEADKLRSNSDWATGLSALTGGLMGKAAAKSGAAIKGATEEGGNLFLDNAPDFIKKLSDSKPVNLIKDSAEKISNLPKNNKVVNKTLKVLGRASDMLSGPVFAFASNNPHAFLPAFADRVLPNIGKEAIELARASKNNVPRIFKNFTYVYKIPKQSPPPIFRPVGPIEGLANAGKSYFRLDDDESSQDVYRRRDFYKEGKFGDSYRKELPWITNRISDGRKR